VSWALRPQIHHYSNSLQDSVALYLLFHIVSRIRKYCQVSCSSAVSFPTILLPPPSQLRWLGESPVGLFPYCYLMAVVNHSQQ
jgi:hypothetical protein